MTDIHLALNIPNYAINLMRNFSNQEVFDEMIKNNGITAQKLFTFGYVNTPIVNNNTGNEIAYVTYWVNKKVTLNVRLNEDDKNHLTLIEVLDPIETSPTKRQSLEIYLKHFPDSDFDDNGEGVLVPIK